MSAYLDPAHIAAIAADRLQPLSPTGWVFANRYEPGPDLPPGWDKLPGVFPVVRMPAPAPEPHHG